MRESYRIERTTACGVELPADVFFDILLEWSAARTTALLTYRST
ncbi:MAG TPA: hypothetical protein VGJ87_25090 [Roseiflexaceae bacterium]|jgi:hypothetical protein